MQDAGTEMSDTKISLIKISLHKKFVKLKNFITKDSGKREKYNSGMQRDTNEEKARFDLILPEGIPYDEQLLTRVANLMARGAVKYNARNWEKASSKEELDRFRESAFRHFMQWICGETDEDHAAAVYFNIMGAEYVKSRTKLIMLKKIKNELDNHRGQ